MKTVILKIPNNSIIKYMEPQINADERRFVERVSAYNGGF